MDTCGQTKRDMQRLTVLSYDEMKICSMYEYDQHKDEIVGKHNYMQVIMARGLSDPWKQPIYVDFDKKITKAILDEVLNELQKIKYYVVACVSDCGGGNMGLWKELNINIDNIYYTHPTSGEKIYFFADVPHILKLTRNWLVDTGFQLKDNTIISKDPIEALIRSTNSEVSSCHKLSMHHLTCQKAQRQNVSLAAQIFSNTTATALKRYLPGDDKKKARDVAEFLEMIGNWFDVLNSYVPNASVPTKRPYGSARLEEQDDLLNKVKSTFTTMRCCNKDALQIFQKGMIVSTSSLQSLYQDLSKKYGIKYILTHRLNQDCLENFFSQIRTKGGLHDHPSPLNALYRIRMILLGKNPGLVQKHTNVPIVEDNEFLLATVMKKAQINCPDISDLIEKDMVSNESCSERSFSSESSVISTSNMAEKDGLIYIAGYLARKFKDKYPTLGKYTYETNQAKTLHTYSMPSWLQHLSFGGLTEPSDSWTKQVLKMEKYFKRYHQSTFSVKENVVEKTVLYILKKTKGIPKDLVKAFARQRIFVRIKYLNGIIKNISLKRKHTGETDEHRKMAKKMKKTTD